MLRYSETWISKQLKTSVSMLSQLNAEFLHPSSQLVEVSLIF